MSFIKLNEHYQNQADAAYRFENQAVEFVDELEKLFGKHRWFSIGRTHIEQGFMALRKGITETYKVDANAPTPDVGK